MSEINQFMQFDELPNLAKDYIYKSILKGKIKEITEIEARIKSEGENGKDRNKYPFIKTFYKVHIEGNKYECFQEKQPNSEWTVVLDMSRAAQYYYDKEVNESLNK